MAGATTIVTDATFKSDGLESDKPVLVDFWATWCGPCRQVAPILEEIANEHGEKLTILKMNVDENPQTPAQYRVTGIPAMAVFTDTDLSVPNGDCRVWTSSGSPPVERTATNSPTAWKS